MLGMMGNHCSKKLDHFQCSKDSLGTQDLILAKFTNQSCKALYHLNNSPKKTPCPNVTPGRTLMPPQLPLPPPPPFIILSLSKF